MADFDKIKEHILSFEGDSSHHVKKKVDNIVLLCSNCFSNEGLRIDAAKVGFENGDSCPNCRSVSGRKLTKVLIKKLCHRFFVRGTITRCKFGGSPKDYAQTQTIPNIALFGRPIKDDKLRVDCINRIVINRVEYDCIFGPVLTPWCFYL